jgi:hypothetical protein
VADEAFRVVELSLQGFNCSQILAQLALEALGREDPLLIRAMTGLQGGLGCGRVCGTLTGACCVLGMYAGRGTVDEQEDGSLAIMLSELVDWFEAEYGAKYGGTDCDTITGQDPSRQLSVCPGMITATFAKLSEILAFHDFSLAGAEEEE